MLKQKLLNDIPYYLQLMRFDRPIGSLLLMWPTLWAVWIASAGDPQPSLVWIFALGVIVMRSAGCVINDYADRKFDPLVERTVSRPLAAGKLSSAQALGLFTALCVIALGLLSLLPSAVWPWSVPAIIITICYPYMKRLIQAPQLVLGLAFSFSIPMVYVAFEHPFDLTFGMLFFMNFCWVLIYDTQYAMSDRADDLKIGVNSTAILFAENDRRVIAALQALVIVVLLMLVHLLNLDASFYVAIGLALACFIYQQWLTRQREPAQCFQAFINNGWFGAFVWFGLITAM